jgi:hypothetical protein
MPSFNTIPTVEWGPTLSAGRKILVAAKAAHYRQPQSFGDMVLTDRGLTTEIAQFQLGDLTFKVPYPHYIYSSALVKVLWLMLGQEFGHWQRRAARKSIKPPCRSDAKWFDAGGNAA